MNRMLVRSASMLWILAQGSFATSEAQQVRHPAPIRHATLGEINKIHVAGQLWLGGQFAPDEVAAIREAGVVRVINLRTDGELEWDEQAAVTAAGLEYETVPFRDASSLTDDVFDRVRWLLANDDQPTLLHCRSSNRVGAVWLPYRVLDEGVPLAMAIEEAKIAGLRSEEMLDKARRYIRRMQMGVAETAPDSENDETQDDDGG